MMSETPQSVTCGDCGKKLAEDPHSPIENRQPCPHCGSELRCFQKKLNATATARTKLRMKARNATGGRPFLERIEGDDLDRKSGKWMQFERLIDRAKNWYSEKVTDPKTGRIIHECQEPLSDHKGHGTAKKPVEQPPSLDV